MITPHVRYSDKIYLSQCLVSFIHTHENVEYMFGKSTKATDPIPDED